MIDPEDEEDEEDGDETEEAGEAEVLYDIVEDLSGGGEGE